MAGFRCGAFAGILCILLGFHSTALASDGFAGTWFLKHTPTGNVAIFDVRGGGKGKATVSIRGGSHSLLMQPTGQLTGRGALPAVIAGNTLYVKGNLDTGSSYGGSMHVTPVLFGRKNTLIDMLEGADANDLIGGAYPRPDMLGGKWTAWKLSDRSIKMTDLYQICTGLVDRSGWESDNRWSCKNVGQLERCHTKYTTGLFTFLDRKDCEEKLNDLTGK